MGTGPATRAVDDDPLGSFVVVVLQVAGPLHSLDRWSPGPFPFAGPALSGQKPRGLVATRDLRRTAFHHRVHDVLYPDGVGAGGRRAHRTIENRALPVADGLFAAEAECLLFDYRANAGLDSRPAEIAEKSDMPGLLCLHVPVSDPSDLQVVSELWTATRNRPGRTELATRVALWLGLIGADDLKPDEHALDDPLFTVAFSTVADGSVDPPVAMPGTAFAEWGAVSQWTWLLASLTPAERFAPTSVDDDTGVELDLSSSWSARVLRNGAAFVARRMTVDGGLDRSLGSLRLYAQTIYLDALLLGVLQKKWLNELADQIADVAVHHHRDLPVVQRLDKELSLFRASVWWRAAAHGSHADKLIGAFQEENRLAELLGDSTAEIAELVRQARTEVDEQTLEAARRTERTVTILTVVALPSVPILAIWQGLTSTGTALSLAITLVVYVLVAIILYSWLTVAQRRRER